jgi:hypothetical protein
VLLAGCHKSFDERYAEARKRIGEQAAGIDKELAERASEAAVEAGTVTPAALPSGAGHASPPR